MIKKNAAGAAFKRSFLPVLRSESESVIDKDHMNPVLVL
jgi:hypothetical protein